MYISNYDIDTIKDRTLKTKLKKLDDYRSQVQKVIDENDTTAPEYSLAHVKNVALHDQIDKLTKQFKDIKHLVLVGIGGSSLGTEAVHKVLDKGKVKLHCLDTISPVSIDKLLKDLATVKNVKKLAICVVSKSGGTTETVVNTGVLLDALELKYKKDIYKQTIFIGNPKTELAKVGKRLGANVVEMPEVVGGRYSVATEVGLIPLALLKHDVDSFISGVVDASTPEFESVVAEDAARLQYYIEKSFTHYNFFAFEPRLEKMGAWYRQLMAESLGKNADRDGKPVTKGMLPTVSTPVELHSIGQLYLSGFSGVYTDFVTFDDVESNYSIPKKGVAKTYGRFDMQEVATALYGGVMSAYQEKSLPYRSTIFTESLPYSLGLFMGMRMLEIMYVAELMNLNAFDQPNVELYKTKTREILGL